MATSTMKNNIGRKVVVCVGSTLYSGTIAGKVGPDQKLKVNVPKDATDPKKGLVTLTVHKSQLRY